MTKQRLYRLSRVCLGILLLTAGNAFSDAAPDPLHKGMSPIRKTSRVRLVSEQVDIFLDAERCDFDVAMVFRNSGPVAESMEVGFPTSYGNEVRDPRVRIDDQPVKTRRSREEEIVREEFEGKPYTKTYPTHWILWDMIFAAEKTHTLRMTYWVRPRKNPDYLITPYTAYRSAITEAYGNAGSAIPPPVKQLIDAMTTCSTGYILRTGSGWDGLIDRAVINVYHRKIGAGAIRWFQPQHSFRLTDRQLTWVFDRFDPDFDIDIEFNDRWTIEQERLRVRSALAYAGDQDALKDLYRYLLGIKVKFSQ